VSALLDSGDPNHSGILPVWIHASSSVFVYDHSPERVPAFRARHFAQSASGQRRVSDAVGVKHHAQAVLPV